LSVGIAFSVGLIAQFLTRLFFTFEYKSRMERWGFIWSGAALMSLFYFILIKGGAHASYMTPEIKAWIASNTFWVMFGGFVFFSIVSLALIRMKINILKIIILIGTGALAMAFAGNDLANFIGVSVAGVHAFLGADLSGDLPTPSWILLLAGVIMVISITTSRKAKTVINTSVDLASHDKNDVCHWKKSLFVEKLSALVVYIYDLVMKMMPGRLRNWFLKRFAVSNLKDRNGASFDLVRAAVNLIISAALISYATFQKLPLSTTYVTFMVAMGTALADGAWGRDCAPYRITGVLTVVSGWFFTAFIAFVMAGIMVSVLFIAKIWGLIGAAVVVVFLIYKLSHIHDTREKLKVKI
jgi:hypothetical protein